MICEEEILIHPMSVGKRTDIGKDTGFLQSTDSMQTWTFLERKGSRLSKVFHVLENSSPLSPWEMNSAR